MPVTSYPRLLGALASATALACTLAISISAPSLTRPFVPGFLLVVVLPVLLSLLVGRLFLFRIPPHRAVLTMAGIGILISLPWLCLAGSEMGRAAWMLWVGLFVLVFALIRFSRSDPWQSRVGLVLGLLVFSFVPNLKVPPAPQDGGLHRVVVFGIDSGNWEFIDGMIAEGELPHLAAMKAEGAHGDLISEEPTASARIWTIIATGVGEERNGIANFGNTRSDLRAGRIWDDVCDQGHDAGVVSWLINTPAWPREGLLYSTPGWVTGRYDALPPQANCVKLLEQLGEEGSLMTGNLMGATLSCLAISSADNAWRILNDAGELLFGRVFRGFGPEDGQWRMKIMRDRLNANLFLELARRGVPDFGAVVMYGADGVGHFFWKYHEAKHGDRSLFPSVTDQEIARRGEAVRNAYRACDEELGRLRAAMGEDTLFVLVSDHGMVPLPESRDDQNLRLRGKVLLKMADMEGEFKTSVVNRFLIVTPSENTPQSQARLQKFSQLCNAAVNLGTGETMFLAATRENRPGTLIVEFIHPRESFDSAHEIRLGKHKTPAEDMFFVQKRSGTHKVEGFFLMAGHGISEGIRVEDVDIYDVAPTVTYALGLPVPEELPGRVVLGAFSEEHLADHPLLHRLGPYPMPPDVDALGAEDVEAMEQRLRAMGYTD